MAKKTKTIKVNTPIAGFGIDVSSNNGSVDWEALREHPEVQFVIIRLSLGYGSPDRNAFAYAAAAKESNKKISYYHFAYPDPKIGDLPDITKDAAKEALYFKGLLDDLTSKGLGPDFSPAIDLEDDPTYQFTRKLTPDEYYKWLTTFISFFPQPGSRPLMIYASPGYLNARLPVGHSLGSLPLWVANYKVKTPQLPVGWTRYDLWQYDAGTIPGVEGTFDLDMAQSGFFV